MEAKIAIEYDDARTAEAVAKAVSPDNFKTPHGLTVKTAYSGCKVVTEISCGEKISTFISTIDDLLFCVSIAEKTIQTTRKLE